MGPSRSTRVTLGLPRMLSSSFVFSDRLTTLRSLWTDLRRRKLLPGSPGPRFLTPVGSLRPFPFLYPGGDSRRSFHVSGRLRKWNRVTLGKVWRLDFLVFSCSQSRRHKHHGTISSLSFVYVPSSMDSRFKVSSTFPLPVLVVLRRTLPFSCGKGTSHISVVENIWVICHPYEQNRYVSFCSALEIGVPPSGPQVQASDSGKVMAVRRRLVSSVQVSF